jgi:cytosine/adenosine deaminase-related metal-dependent hydrolase
LDKFHDFFELYIVGMNDQMKCVEGMIYQNTEFIRGYINFEDGTIIDVKPGSCPSSHQVVSKGVILPLLNNCHTHIGDAIARGRELTADIEKLVAPPNGLKFQILRSSSTEELWFEISNTPL